MTIVERISLAAAFILLGCLTARAADLCKARVLRDIVIEGSTSVLKKGEFVTAVTQYRVDTKTGEATFCSHGGGCYPTHIDDNGVSVEALALTNCEIAKKGDTSDPEETVYDVKLIRAKVSPADLKYNDVSKRLGELGLCNACASNAASLYVKQPQSQCGRLVREVLEGNPVALKRLSGSPDYCQ
jgi:hypothetical protein